MEAGDVRAVRWWAGAGPYPRGCRQRHESRQDLPDRRARAQRDGDRTYSRRAARSALDLRPCRASGSGRAIGCLFLRVRHPVAQGGRNRPGGRASLSGPPRRWAQGMEGGRVAHRVLSVVLREPGPDLIRAIPLRGNDDEDHPIRPCGADRGTGRRPSAERGTSLVPVVRPICRPQRRHELHVREFRSVPRHRAWDRRLLRPELVPRPRGAALRPAPAAPGSLLALLLQIFSGTGFPNQLFSDSWVVGFWRGRPWLAGHRIGETSLEAG